MLLWELLFEKIPYEDWDVTRIKEHVLDNKREKITFGRANPNIQKLQQNYAKIIVSGKIINIYIYILGIRKVIYKLKKKSPLAWQDDPILRASLQQIFLDLHALHKEFCSLATTSPPLKPSGSIDFDGSREALAPVSELDLPDLDDIPEIMLLEESVAAHKSKANIYDDSYVPLIVIFTKIINEIISIYEE